MNSNKENLKFQSIPTGTDNTPSPSTVDPQVKGHPRTGTRTNMNQDSEGRWPKLKVFQFMLVVMTPLIVAVFFITQYGQPNLERKAQEQAARDHAIFQTPIIMQQILDELVRLREAIESDRNRAARS